MLLILFRREVHTALVPPVPHGIKWALPTAATTNSINPLRMRALPSQLNAQNRCTYTAQGPDPLAQHDHVLSRCGLGALGRAGECPVFCHIVPHVSHYHVLLDALSTMELLPSL